MQKSTVRLLFKSMTLPISCEDRAQWIRRTLYFVTVLRYKEIHLTMKKDISLMNNYSLVLIAVSEAMRSATMWRILALIPPKHSFQPIIAVRQGGHEGDLVTTIH